jgi:hypothetical protein
MTPPSATVRIGKTQIVPVRTWAEASLVAGGVRDADAMGATAYYASRIGIVRDAAGRVVGHVSYNGRCWLGSAKAHDLGPEVVDRNSVIECAR